MTIVVLAALAIVWVVVLGSYAKERFADHHRDSVSAFRTQLRTLQRTQRGQRPALGQPQSASFNRSPMGGSPMGGVAIDAELARRRRKAVLLGLLSFAVVAVLSVLVAASLLTLVLAIVAVGGLAGYVALLVDRQRLRIEQRAKVRQIRPARHVHGEVAAAPTSRRVAVVASARR